MRKTTHVFYDEMDVRKIVGDELNKAKPEWVQEITESVTKVVGDKFDRVMTVLDKFVGEIKSYREEQILHQNQHDEINLRLKKLEHPVL